MTASPPPTTTPEVSVEDGGEGPGPGESLARDYIMLGL